MFSDCYVVVTCIGRHITDIEVLDSMPKFPPVTVLDRKLYHRVFLAGMNGGDSIEMHFNYETWSWES